ncbi:hypothetical protein NC653_033496 [Populus alba x Populus x berolinensis]|uniref:Uncharacterized protein n=1 Tax=Populus alba x Populus x berolinensis TaxID=444605 RepID=A0AAD6LU43_9ROSI|nr:hypothetical protein NC653_033496 [Populus alba x Populus x berolinensis]
MTSFPIYKQRCLWKTHQVCSHMAWTRPGASNGESSGGELSTLYRG